ncbi:MAG: sporulation protein YabP [Bacilli bacterium]|nr:sporulation protein YabP [Bacilli bacterium]
MEKFAENISYNHGISINERKLVYITGVVKIESFDEEEFLLETNMGYLAIKGSGLEIVRLDTKDGILSIKGNVDSFSYFDNLKKNSKGSFMEKLFK